MNKPAYFPSDSSEPARAKSESQRSFESKPQDPKWKHFVHVPDPILSLSLLFFYQVRVRSDRPRFETHTVHTGFRIFGKIRSDPSCLTSISPPSHQDPVDLCAFWFPRRRREPHLLLLLLLGAHTPPIFSFFFFRSLCRISAISIYSKIALAESVLRFC